MKISHQVMLWMKISIDNLCPKVKFSIVYNGILSIDTTISQAAYNSMTILCPSRQFNLQQYSYYYSQMNF